MWAQPFLKSEAPISRKEWVDIEKIQTVTTESILFLPKGFHRKPFLFSPIRPWSELNSNAETLM